MLAPLAGQDLPAWHQRTTGRCRHPFLLAPARVLYCSRAGTLSYRINVALLARKGHLKVITAALCAFEGLRRLSFRKVNADALLRSPSDPAGSINAIRFNNEFECFRIPTVLGTSRQAPVDERFRTVQVNTDRFWLKTIRPPLRVR
jgi:hypothetical protein